MEKIGIIEFTKEIETEIKGLQSRYEFFDSGAFCLDFKIHNFFFVIDYSPTYGYLIDEVRENEGFNSGYNYHTKNFDEAKNILRKIILEKLDLKSF